MPSIKKNLLYNSTLTVSNYLFPFLTYPYVSRILGVANIGIYNWIDSIINYYIIFSVLGIGTVGIREIARVKNNKKEVSQVFSSLLILNGITTFLMLIILVLSAILFPTLAQYKSMLIIGGVKLVFNYLLIEWFYIGIEKFKYITIRSILIKILYVISVFLFVKETDDYSIYYLLTTLMIVLSAFLNMIHSRKYVMIKFDNILFRPYIKPLFTFGLYGFLSTMYASFNVAFLGLVTNEIEVGYYSTAIKLYVIFLSMFTAFTGVMLPRLSSLVQLGEMKQFQIMINKSIELLLVIVLPLVVISIIYAPQIINVISGSQYGGAILPMRIVMPLLLIIGYEQILVKQILIPLKQDKIVFYNTILGILINIFLNILWVKTFGSAGSSCVWLFSECIMICSIQYFFLKKIHLKISYKKIANNILYSIPAFIFSYYFVLYCSSYMADWIVLIIGASLVFLYFICLHCLVLKNTIALEIFSVLLNLKKM